MALKIVDFETHWKRRKVRELAREMSQLVKSGIAWSVSADAMQFLNENGLDLMDLDHLVQNIEMFYPTKKGAEFGVRGYTLDNSLVLIYIQLRSDSTQPCIRVMGGRMLSGDQEQVI